MSHWPFLSLLIWVPTAGAVPVLLAGDRRPRLARWLALLATTYRFGIGADGTLALIAPGARAVARRP